jgi:hypothetical protein
MQDFLFSGVVQALRKVRNKQSAKQYREKQKILKGLMSSEMERMEATVKLLVDHGQRLAEENRRLKQALEKAGLSVDEILGSLPQSSSDLCSTAGLLRPP